MKEGVLCCFVSCSDLTTVSCCFPQVLWGAARHYLCPLPAASLLGPGHPQQHPVSGQHPVLPRYETWLKVPYVSWVGEGPSEAGGPALDLSFT